MSARACCKDQGWTPVADLGEARGFGFDLGRCPACGAWLMAVAYAEHPTLNVVSEAEAQRFLALRGTDGLRKALRAWVE